MLYFIMFPAIVLGIIQGLTEFLPVSSSAHLVIIPWFFKWDGIVNSIAFDVALHLGTLLALLIYFRNDWIEILRTLPRKDSMVWKLLIGTIPAGIAGFFFHDFFESARSPLLIVLTLCFVSLLMISSERSYNEQKSSGMERLGIFDSFFIGIAQAFALIPGVSRSGITIIAGLKRGLRRDSSARFSFLLSTPAVLGANMLEARKLMKIDGIDYGIFIIGVAVSAITGYIAIRFLLRFFRSHTLIPFAYYRFILASVIIIVYYGKV